MSVVLDRRAETETGIRQILDDLAATAARSFERGRSLPPAVYTAPEALELEMERIFRKEWICVGRAAEIPNPGDYQTHEIAGQPIFVIRQKDRSLQAFANVCLHRCTKLLEGSGNKRRIVCPYHAWTYDSNGQLIGAPHMGKTPEFIVKDHRLHEVRLETWEGFIYVTLNPDATSIAERLTGLTEVVGRYRMADYEPLICEEEVWNTNWKCLVENFMDAYHIFKVHRSSFEQYGNSAAATTLLPGGDAYTYHLVNAGPENEYSVAHSDNTWLDGEFRHTIVLACAFPSHTMQLQPDMLWYLNIHPQGTDRVKIRWAVSVPKEVIADVKDRDAHIDEIRKLLVQVNSEDRPTIERIRQGVNYVSATQGPLSHLELNVYEFGRYLARRLTG